MEKDFELLEVDWVTAQMYGKNLLKRFNDISNSKNGIELYDELNDEVNELIDAIDHTVFAPKKESFWENDAFP
jgi:hypothetical protein